jgi:uncharacterized membrane protein (GlpM family)
MEYPKYILQILLWEFSFLYGIDFHVLQVKLNFFSLALAVLCWIIAAQIIYKIHSTNYHTSLLLNVDN